MKKVKRWTAVFTVVVLLLGLFCGCAEKPREETAFAGELVENDQPKPNEQTQKEEQSSAPTPDEEIPDAPVENKPVEQPAEKEPEPEIKQEPDTKPEEQNPAEDNPTDKPEEEQPPKFSMDQAVKVVTFNIKNAMGGKSIDQIATMLYELDADLIGLQEVDCNTSRSGGVNQVQVIAEKAGYPYYYFTSCIAIGDNHTPYTGETNAVGTAIISKHPILKSEVIWPGDQGDYGLRNFARHEIDIDGKTVAFYNGHLDFSKGRFQYEEVQNNYMSKDKYAICVGDFNETMDEMFLQFDYENFHSLAFGNEMENPYLNAKGNQVIDHIVVSKRTILWYDEEVQNGYYVVPHNGASDHNLIYGYFNLLD